ncbi:YqhR family membrane protein [Bacillus salinus]|uniref:YqhR family membrane protein n=1 Tax=Bacillus sp. HMF5848 TaxID=2495421 RepID=UPI0037C09203
MLQNNSSEQNEKLEQNQREKPISFPVKILMIGLFGGLFWSFLGYLAYIINFTEIAPNMILEPWAVGEWKQTILGQFISIVVIGAISIAVAFLYYAVLKKYQNIWIGAIFGAVLWGVVFYLLNPIFQNVPAVTELKRNTIITNVCLYILYGVFIGYSITFEYNELQVNNREEQNTPETQTADAT